MTTARLDTTCDLQIEQLIVSYLVRRGLNQSADLLCRESLHLRCTAANPSIFVAHRLFGHVLEDIVHTFMDMHQGVELDVREPLRTMLQVLQRQTTQVQMYCHLNLNNGVGCEPVASMSSPGGACSFNNNITQTIDDKTAAQNQNPLLLATNEILGDVGNHWSTNNTVHAAQRPNTNGEPQASASLRPPPVSPSRPSGMPHNIQQQTAPTNIESGVTIASVGNIFFTHSEVNSMVDHINVGLLHAQPYDMPTLSPSLLDRHVPAGPDRMTLVVDKLAHQLTQNNANTNRGTVNNNTDTAVAVTIHTPLKTNKRTLPEHSGSAPPVAGPFSGLGASAENGTATATKRMRVQQTDQSVNSSLVQSTNQRAFPALTSAAAQINHQQHPKAIAPRPAANVPVPVHTKDKENTTKKSTVSRSKSHNQIKSKADKSKVTVAFVGSRLSNQELELANQQQAAALSTSVLAMQEMMQQSPVIVNKTQQNVAAAVPSENGVASVTRQLHLRQAVAQSKVAGQPTPSDSPSFTANTALNQNRARSTAPPASIRSPEIDMTSNLKPMASESDTATKKPTAGGVKLDRKTAAETGGKSVAKKRKRKKEVKEEIVPSSGFGPCAAPKKTSAERESYAKEKENPEPLAEPEIECSKGSTTPDSDMIIDVETVTPVQTSTPPRHNTRKHTILVDNQSPLFGDTVSGTASVWKSIRTTETDQDKTALEEQGVGGAVLQLSTLHNKETGTLSHGQVSPATIAPNENEVSNPVVMEPSPRKVAARASARRTTGSGLTPTKSSVKYKEGGLQISLPLHSNKPDRRHTRSTNKQKHLEVDPESETGRNHNTVTSTAATENVPIVQEVETEVNGDPEATAAVQAQGTELAVALAALTADAGVDSNVQLWPAVLVSPATMSPNDNDVSNPVVIEPEPSPKKAAARASARKSPTKSSVKHKEGGLQISLPLRLNKPDKRQTRATNKQKQLKVEPEPRTGENQNSPVTSTATTQNIPLVPDVETEVNGDPEATAAAQAQETELAVAVAALIADDGADSNVQVWTAEQSCTPLVSPATLPSNENDVSNPVVIDPEPSPRKAAARASARESPTKSSVKHKEGGLQISLPLRSQKPDKRQTRATSKQKQLKVQPEPKAGGNQYSPVTSTAATENVPIVPETATNVEPEATGPDQAQETELAAALAALAADAGDGETTADPNVLLSPAVQGCTALSHDQEEERNNGLLIEENGTVGAEAELLIDESTGLAVHNTSPMQLVNLPNFLGVNDYGDDENEEEDMMQMLGIQIVSENNSREASTGKDNEPDKGDSDMDGKGHMEGDSDMDCEGDREEELDGESDRDGDKSEGECDSDTEGTPRSLMSIQSNINGHGSGSLVTDERKQAVIRHLHK